jgi:transcriptional regulator with XRE-family HTH domain
MNIGKTIKEIRESKKIKQKELSESCSLTVSYLSQIENNKKDPSISVLRKISNSLEIPLPIIFFMSLDETDIPDRKIEFYKMIHPSLNGLLKEFF